MMYAKSLWLCPVCCTPVWVDWERGMFLCPECDKDLWEVETEQEEAMMEDTRKGGKGEG